VRWLPEKKLESKKNQHKQRIVQTTLGQTQEQPSPDAFLGIKNQKVERETVSVQSKLMSRPHKTSSEKRISKKNKENHELAKLGIRLSLPLHQTAQDSFRWASLGAEPQEFIKGKVETNHTALNTREFRFFGYFQRIRERLDQAWVSILKNKLKQYFEAGHHLSNDQNYTTQLVVVLNKNGQITRVQLIEESGTRDLDEAAIIAFQRAGPFPNPPKDLVNAQGEIHIPWDFILRT
jgi:protein TonB